MSSINAADAHRSTRSSAYTSAVFSETRYALNGDLRVAYRASREGARDIVFVPNWFTNCEVFPELPPQQGWVEAMTSLGRLIFFDQPGTGASDPVTPGALPTLEQWTDSITAVLDDLGSREAVLLAVDGALATAALFAATHPSRTTALVVLEGYADAGDRTEWVGDEALAAMVAMWGTGELQHVLNPDMPWNEEIRATWARQERLAASPRTVALMFPLVSELNVRAILPTVRVPTLVVHHSRRPVHPARRWARTSPITYRARNTLSYRGATCTTSSNRGARPSRRSPSSSPASRPTWPTIGFSPRCCSPTSWTRRAGRRRWATVTGMPCSMRTTPSSGHSSTRFRGREVNTSGDGFLAMFDGPQRAIRCAMAIRDAVQALGIEVRAGLHTGECEVRGDDIGGIAVHIGARVSALAGPNDVLVSSTLRDLVIGSGLEFEDRGAHELKGVPGEWRLFAVAST